MSCFKMLDLIQCKDKLREKLKEGHRKTCIDMYIDMSIHTGVYKNQG